MAKGDIQEGGRRRKEPTGAKVAARVAQYVDEPRRAVGVTPLNAGFFKLERMRTASVAKKRSVKKRKLRQ